MIPNFSSLITHVIKLLYQFLQCVMNMFLESEYILLGEYVGDNFTFTSVFRAITDKWKVTGLGRGLGVQNGPQTRQ
jgi:hypothetical protein